MRLRCLLPVACAGVLPAPAIADAFLEARIAQREGRFADCVRHSDEARRQPNNTFHSHRLHANCLVAHADVRRSELGGEAYAQELEKAVEALRVIAATPGGRHQTKSNEVLEFSIRELSRKAAEARAGSK